MPIQPGTKLGAYEVRDLLGQGAMGVVYGAFHLGLNRSVAVKVLHALAPDPEAAARFQLEAQAIARLRHPGILNVYDFGEFEGTPYMVIELVAGGSLGDRMRRGSPPPEIAIGILRGVGAALDHAHSVGIVHRDVKPSNVLIHRDGSPVLADFGLAKLMLSSGVRTMTGTTTGTPAYMAPEQATGGAVGPPADRYALAVMAYEMLTGVQPFTAEGPMELLYAHVHRDPRPPSVVRAGLPPAADPVLLRGLAKDPAARWESCSAFVEALDRSGRGRAAASVPPPPIAVIPPAAVRPPSPSQPAAVAAEAGPRRRTRWMAAALVALIVVACLVFTAAILRRPPALDPLSSNSVIQGGTVVLSGHHMPARADGIVQIASASRTDLVAFQSDRGGDFTVSVTIPVSTPPGGHQLFVCWNQGCPLSTAIEVRARPLPTPSPSPTPSPTPPRPSPSPTPGVEVQPASPHLTGTITVQASGLKATDRAFVVLVQNGGSHLLGANLVVQANGTTVTSTTMPGGLKAGQVEVRACNGTSASPTNCQSKQVTILP